MKITRIQGLACFAGMALTVKLGGLICAPKEAWDALDELRGGMATFDGDVDHALTAMAWCATLAGVKP